MTSMPALLHESSMIVGAAHDGKAVCARPRNLLQAWEVQKSALSNAFQGKSFSRFNCMRASSLSANSSVNLANSNFHAHSFQATANHDNVMVDDISNRLEVGRCTKTGHNIDVQERQQAALDYVVPDFIPPVAFKLNPGLEEANKSALKWAAHHFESAMSPEIFQSLFHLGNLHHLAGAVHPDAPISRLDIAIAFYAWVFVLDDESLPERCSVEELVQMHLEIQVVIMSAFPQEESLKDNLEKYVSNEFGRYEFTKEFVESVVAKATVKPLFGTEYDAQISPVASSLRDLLIRAISMMPAEEWSLRFARILQREVLANFLESLNLHHDICPSTSAYIALRRGSGLAASSFMLEELLHDVFLPDLIYYSLPLQRLLEATIDADLWNNDLWSFPKELLAGEVANLVLLISKEKGCSYNEGEEIVTEMVVEKCKEMQLAAVELREYCRIHHELTSAQKAAVERTISCCNQSLSASHGFNSQCFRYLSKHKEFRVIRERVRTEEM